MVSWMVYDVECDSCKKHSSVVLGAKIKEEKPIAKCPRCKATTIKILSAQAKEAPKT